MKLFFSRVASPFGEEENVEVRKRKYENESAERTQCGSEKVDSQTFPVWAGHPAHTGNVWEVLVLSWFTRLAKG